jgi:hypothetical protein
MDSARLNRMEDENTEDNFDDIAFMPRRHWVVPLAAICFAVAVLGGVMWALSETNANTNLTFQGNRRATDIRGRAATPLRESFYKDPASPVGTSGLLTTATAGQPAGTSAAAEPIQDLSTILGTDNPRTLVGRRVEISVPVVQDQTLTKFWIGPQEDRMLVVLARDTRDGGERQASVPPQHGIVPLRRGQGAVVSGVVERVPRPEERASWDLTAAQTRDVERRGVYIRADKVTAQ